MKAGGENISVRKKAESMPSVEGGVSALVRRPFTDNPSAGATAIVRKRIINAIGGALYLQAGGESVYLTPTEGSGSEARLYSAVLMGVGGRVSMWRFGNQKENHLNLSLDQMVGLADTERNDFFLRVAVGVGMKVYAGRLPIQLDLIKLGMDSIDYDGYTAGSNHTRIDHVVATTGLSVGLP